jgi:hypothetical protein
MDHIRSLSPNLGAGIVSSRRNSEVEKIATHIRLVGDITVITDISLDNIRGQHSQECDYIEVEGRYYPGGYNSKDTKFLILKNNILLFQEIKG